MKHLFTLFQFKVETQAAKALLLSLPILFLTACGGSVTINTPAKQQVYLKSDTVEFDISFKDIDPLNARFELNGEDVTGDFIIDLSNNSAQLALPASEILDERSHFSVNVDGTEKSVRFFVDRSAPEVVVTHFSPNLLGNLPHITYTIEGYVTDLSAIADTGLLNPQVRYGVNFNDQVQFFELDEDNHFSVTLETQAMGNEFPESLESAPIRFLVSDVTPFDVGLQTSNDSYASVTRQPPFARAHITAKAFENTINPKVNAAIAAVDFEELALAANPAVNKDVVLSNIPGVPEVTIPIPVISDPNLLGIGGAIRIDVTSLDIGNVDIDVAPTSSLGKPSLAADVFLSDLDIRIRTALSLELPILPDPTIPINTRVNGSDLIGDAIVRLRIDGNDSQAPKIAIDSVSLDLSVFGGDFDTIDFSGLPWPLDVALGALAELFIGAIEQFAFELLDDYIANLVGDKLADSLVEKVNDELQLIPSSLETTFRGKEFDFYATEAVLAANSNGLNVSISKSDVTVRPFGDGITKELGWQLNETGSFKSFSSTTPTGGQSYELGLSLDWDFLNKTLFEAHRAGIDQFSTEFEGGSIPVVGDKLENTLLRVTVKPQLAPYIDKPIPRNDPAIASVNAKEFGITLEARDVTQDEDFRNIAEIRANIRTDVDLDVEGNFLKVLLDTDPEINIRSVTINENEQLIGEKILQNIINFVVPEVMPNVVDIIEAIRLPCVKGHTLDLLELESTSLGYFNLYANVDDSAGACPSETLAEPEPQPPARPFVQVEFVGCNNTVPQFLVNVLSRGGDPDEFNVQVRQGSGSFFNFTGTVYNGASGRNDTFRANACNENGCSSFASDSTGSISCGSTGGGGGGGDEPPTHPK